MPIPVITGTLHFNTGNAVASMNSAATAFRQMHQSSKQAQSGMQTMRNTMSQAGAVGTSVVRNSGFVVESFMNFEQAMATVRSIYGSGLRDMFPALTNKANEMGEKTQFTATQAAQAMESLARAGLSPKEVLSSINHVLDVASAEGMSLATAAEIMSKNMRAFNLPASEAQYIVDSFAYVSRNTNSNMIGLQEGMKFAASGAKELGIPLDEAVKLLGLLNDQGRNNTLAGTALNNMFVKLSANMRNGVLPITDSLNAKVEKNADGSIMLTETLMNVSAAMNKIKDRTERVNVGMKLFGIRGKDARSAVGRLLDDTEMFDKMFGKAGSRNAIKGTAEDMKKMRMDNITGDWLFFTSALDGATRSFMTFFNHSMRTALGAGGVGGLTSILSNFSAAFKYYFENPKKLAEEVQTRIPKVNQVVADMAKGLARSATEAGKGFDDLTTKAIGWFATYGALSNQSVSQTTTNTANTVGSYAKWIVAIAGVSLAYKGFMFVFSPITGLLGAAIKWMWLKVAASTALATAVSGMNVVFGAFGPAMAVMTAALAGFSVGTMIYELTGLKEWLDKVTLSYIAWKNATQVMSNELKLKKGVAVDALQDIMAVLQAGKSKTIQFKEGGPREVITREFATEKARKTLEDQKLTKEQVDSQMAALKPMLDRIPTADKVVLSQEEFQNALKKGLKDGLKVNVMINGKSVTQVVANEAQDAKERGQKTDGRMSQAKGTAVPTSTTKK